MRWRIGLEVSCGSRKAEANRDDYEPTLAALQRITDAGDRISRSDPVRHQYAGDERARRALPRTPTTPPAKLSCSRRPWHCHSGRLVLLSSAGMSSDHEWKLLLGKCDDGVGVIIRPRRNMKVFFFHRLRREAQARERDLYYDEDRMRWKYPPTRWFVGTEAARRSGGGRARSPG